MTTIRLFYATNRAHEGEKRFRPTGYGTKFSDDGVENLRFGKLTLEADDTVVKKHLDRDLKAMGRGDGEKLAGYLATQAESATIVAYAEKLKAHTADRNQPDAKLGSAAMFADLKEAMLQSSDVLIYIHGFNVSWCDAVGAAAALQLRLNATAVADPAQEVAVVLFTWPSDGMALPFASYKSDRTEGAGSGYAFGRGLLKVKDFLAAMRDRAKDGEPLCEQDIHLLCHSMGNYVLQNSIERIDEFTPGNALPRLFEHIFLCAPDVDDNVLEQEQPMGRVHELARCVTIYYNREDTAMAVSDHTKGNAERLGANGAARPAALHNKIHQVDCTPVVDGLVEHSYYLSGIVNDDIRQSIDGAALGAGSRLRDRDPNLVNVWAMRPAS